MRRLMILSILSLMALAMVTTASASLAGTAIESPFGLPYSTTTTNATDTATTDQVPAYMNDLAALDMTPSTTMSDTALGTAWPYLSSSDLSPLSEISSMGIPGVAMPDIDQTLTSALGSVPIDAIFSSGTSWPF